MANSFMHQRAVSRVRDFTRFYTNLMGILDQHILDSPFSLSEARVFYEVNNTENCTARKIMQTLKIDEGYLSRILNRFLRQGLIRKMRSPVDGRSFILTVTPKGRLQFQRIDTASAESVNKLIGGLSPKQVDQLIAFMDGIQKLLSNAK